MKHADERLFAPIPPTELGLDSRMAEPWFKVSDDTLQLEGLCFDRTGHLYFVEVFGGTVFRLDPGTRKLDEVLKLAGQNPASVKIHKDGRLYIACLGDFKAGGLVIVNPDGSGKRTILQDYVVDDLVFDSEGGFYFTHFVGSPGDPSGGVFHVDPSEQVTPIAVNMAGPNGVALSKDERVLWITETNANRLHRIDLAADRKTIAPYGTSVPYYFTGYHGPDSCSIDADDNLYVAMYHQGRVMAFNRFGFPIGQFLIPGREQGHHLLTTHPMLVPGSTQLLICTNDPIGKNGSWIFSAQGYAQSHRSYQFQ
ncbi:SMP-30/gluconolactonase/LRE family protein [Herbaspirillum sp. alder98]|uniref:SMP-30/gluconolactonase/LRE family protein n=1 Tax=Herbaspirillum sp. alder98 TaxID=2913096 RepID=UPI001CD86A60|nr:SMP-30/gluconolactonase/LRE family protein [Herbaspirillum sp. alder98]MCA1326371.1 SMP-30/gluconolactonase/LRE family protein [Herbaspirillum sp. alder98]